MSKTDCSAVRRPTCTEEQPDRFAGAIMIVLVGLVLLRVIPASWLDEARQRLTADEADRASASSDHGGEVAGADEPLRGRLRSRRGWSDAAGSTVSDLSMPRKELVVVGFVIAGYLAALVLTAFWRSIFLAGHGFDSSFESFVLGPFLAIINFVCSVGNAPLAAAL